VNYCLQLQSEKLKCRTAKAREDWKKRSVVHSQLHTGQWVMMTNFSWNQIRTFRFMHISFNGKQPSRLPHIMPIPKSTQLINVWSWRSLEWWTTQNKQNSIILFRTLVSWSKHYFNSTVWSSDASFQNGLNCSTMFLLSSDETRETTDINFAGGQLCPRRKKTGKFSSFCYLIHFKWSKKLL